MVLGLAAALLSLLELKLVRECLFLNDALNQRVKVSAFLVISRTNVVYAVIKKKVGNLVLFSLLVNGNRNTALFFDKGHARNIGDTVAKIDHVLIRNFAFANFIVYLFIFGLVVNSLGNTEYVLCFLSVVDGDFGPDSLAVLVVKILAGKNLFEKSNSTLQRSAIKAVFSKLFVSLGKTCFISSSVFDVAFSSVVERESLFDEDRPKIAGVFMNRLEMFLHSICYHW